MGQAAHRNASGNSIVFRLTIQRSRLLLDKRCTQGHTDFEVLVGFHFFFRRRQECFKWFCVALSSMQ